MLTGYVNNEVFEPCTDSDSAWSLIANWLGQCSSTHERCVAACKDSKPLPFHVIDVTPGQPPRLIIVGESTRLDRYATLSHCWGSHMPLRLLSSTTATLQTEIPFSDLSRTFQDAIITTRRLGIHYLWIDSLCIIQDCPQEQSATMARVYSNSHCNITAAHAKDGTYGCFTHRNPTSVKFLKLELKWGLNPGSYLAIQSGYWQDIVSRAPLNMRAWVFQERMLAPRNLYFSATEVFFECLEGSASEQFPARLPPQIAGVAFGSLQPRSTDRASGRRGL